MNKQLVIIFLLAVTLFPQPVELAAQTRPAWEQIQRTPVVSPEQYGAKGDGITDDSAAISAAISTFAANGGVLLLKAGATYIVNSPLSVATSNTTISGYGATLKKTSGAGYLLRLGEAGQTISHITVQGVRFEVANDSGVPTGAIAALSDAPTELYTDRVIDHLVLQDIQVLGCSAIAIELSCRVPNLFVSNVTISEWGDTVAGTWFATGFTLFPKDVVYGVTLADISVSVASGCLLTDAAAIKIENIRGGNISGLTGAGGTSGAIFIQQCEDTQISNINITGTATVGLSITQDLAGAAGCLTSPYAGPAALTIENVNIRGSHTVAVALRQISGLYLKNVFIAQGAGYVTGLTGTTTTISDCVFSDIVAEKGSACLMAKYAGATTNNSVFRNITTLDRSGDNTMFTISGNNNRIQGVYSNAMQLSGDSNYVTDVDLSVASTARNSLEISGSKNLVSGVAEHTHPSYYHAALFGTGTYNIVDLVTKSGIIKSFSETPQLTNVVNGTAREVTGSSTLSIFRAQKILLANTASTTIDTLIGDTRDGTVLLYSNNNNTTLQHSSNLVLSGGVDYLIPANKGVLLFKSGVTYREIARD